MDVTDRGQEAYNVDGYLDIFLGEVNFEWAFRNSRITFCLSDSSYFFLKNTVMILKINGESD